jgi:hypothetical protein
MPARRYFVSSPRECGGSAVFKTYYFVEARGAPFAAGRAVEALAARFPRAAGITLTRSLAEQIDASSAPAFAGAVELWHDRPADALARAEAEAVPTLLAPGARLGPVVTGLARVVLRTVAHHEHRGVKGVFPFRRRAGMEVAAFQARWWHGHGPIAARTEGASHYLQVHPLRETYCGAPPAFDGVTELHWADVAAGRRAMASRPMRVGQGGDSPHFAAAGSVRLFLAEEEIVRAP